MHFSYGEREIEHLKQRDARLGAVIERLGRIERTVDEDLFAAVVRHIAGQQISMKAQQTVWGRLVSSLGEVTPATVTQAQIPTLRAAGLSGRKVEYIRDFAQRVLDGGFDIEAVREMTDEEAIRALSALKGIGVWTAEMLLLFSLQRPDILSFDDLGIQRGMRMVYRHRQIDRARFERYRRRLSPCGSVASLYFWAVAGGALPELTDPAARKKPGG
jgi:DNA-3-methyladenine glycosylase II